MLEVELNDRARSERNLRDHVDHFAPSFRSPWRRYPNLFHLPHAAVTRRLDAQSTARGRYRRDHSPTKLRLTVRSSRIILRPVVNLQLRSELRDCSCLRQMQAGATACKSRLAEFKRRSSVARNLAHDLCGPSPMHGTIPRRSFSRLIFLASTCSRSAQRGLLFDFNNFPAGGSLGASSPAPRSTMPFPGWQRPLQVPAMPTYPWRLRPLLRLALTGARGGFAATATLCRRGTFLCSFGSWSRRARFS
jgi:hypothetical protein